MTQLTENITIEQLNVRPMNSADLTAVLIIERNAQVVPWGRLSFEESLSREHICRVIEVDDTVVAFYVVCPIADELHILNLAVAKHYQGHGIGHVLIKNIVELAGHAHEGHKISKIFLEVRAANTVAQNLYSQWQFKQISVRKAYYRTVDKGREDALVLVKTIGKKEG